REVERRHVHAERDLLRRAAEEPGSVVLRAREDRFHGAAGGVRRTEVARGLAQRVRDRLPDFVRHLRAARRVEEREAVVERREPLANRLDVHGVSPWRMRAKTAAWMLPPDTMQTTFRAPVTRPVSTAAAASAPAPSAMTRVRSASVRTASAASEIGIATAPS